MMRPCAASLTFMLCTVALFFVAGCASTADLAKNQSSTCDVHNCAMTVQVVDCIPGGFSGYDTQFSSAMRSGFPSG